MNIIDTRDLIEKRTQLIEDIIFLFNETFNTDYEDFEVVEKLVHEETSSNIPDHLLDEFSHENEDIFEEIKEIDNIENELGSEFNYGVELIDEDDFEEYTENLIDELGYNIPPFIVIDWDQTAETIKEDYTSVNYNGITYLARV